MGTFRRKVPWQVYCGLKRFRHIHGAYGRLCVQPTKVPALPRNLVFHIKEGKVRPLLLTGPDQSYCYTVQFLWTLSNFVAVCLSGRQRLLLWFCVTFYDGSNYRVCKIGTLFFRKVCPALRILFSNLYCPGWHWHKLYWDIPKIRSLILGTFAILWLFFQWLQLVIIHFRLTWKATSANM